MPKRESVLDFEIGILDLLRRGDRCELLNFRLSGWRRVMDNFAISKVAVDVGGGVSKGGGAMGGNFDFRHEGAWHADLQIWVSELRPAKGESYG